MRIKLQKIPCFGVAGNFTGHLEQAGEAKDFESISSKDNAPKAIFPTYLPCKNKTNIIPEFLKIFPFSCNKIVFPNDNKDLCLQLEPECGIVFSIKWQNSKIIKIDSICFASSNDCSIRKEGAKKISQKKNWGIASKGFCKKQIKLKNFDNSSFINNFKIISFLQRDNQFFQYGEDSFIKDYSYIYETLCNWLIDHFNNQVDLGPQENLSLYLKELNYPKKVFVSIGATRYTDFGQNNYLQKGDKTFVILYNSDYFTKNTILENIKNNKIKSSKDISILYQKYI